ncbi:hypothetical protein OV203_26100 [Nannocystis sp. ILAH1]|uniref:hypothetical protein n=1 Tax=Nannocystis sp. ILAH1 TaxID=2996789 RepID=UPI0022702087|nr:hypothetical protein [Nannocystis sp. ILAH1]MCY0990643.1 hypothetical protein [Nannocystis sp. ILAH1]
MNHVKLTFDNPTTSGTTIVTEETFECSEQQMTDTVSVVQIIWSPREHGEFMPQCITGIELDGRVAVSWEHTKTKNGSEFDYIIVKLTFSA